MIIQVVAVGPPGTGKAAAIRGFIASLREHFYIVMMKNTISEPFEGVSQHTFEVEVQLKSRTS